MEGAGGGQAHRFDGVFNLSFFRTKTVSKSWGSMTRFETLEMRRRRFIIDPLSDRYRFWWYFTTICAVVTALFTPWEVAFQVKPGLRPYDDFEAMVEYFLTTIFVIDIFINFNLAFPRGDGLAEYSRKEIFVRYFRLMFWIDLIGVIPVGAIAVDVFGESDDRRIRFLALFRFLRLVRLHRIFRLFRELETNISLSRLAVTLIRNLMIVILSTHVAGCVFYFISTQHGLTDTCVEGLDEIECEIGDDIAARDIWIGATLEDDFLELSKAEKYMYSLYWSITTMTTVGYGDFSPKNTAEVIFAMIYMLYNIALNSYILGTITLMVVKADENTGALRESYRNVNTFANLNALPMSLKKSLKHHVHFNLAHPEIQDDFVLQGLPAGLRRGVLKELYVKRLQGTQTFKECSQKFLTALMRDVRVDTYLPFQRVFDEGEVVPELHLMLAGEAIKKQYSDSKNWDSPMKEVGRYSNGALFYPEAFFNNEPMPWAVDTATICRVLVIPMETYDNAAAQFPTEDSIVKKNLQCHCQQAQGTLSFELCDQGLHNPVALQNAEGSVTNKENGRAGFEESGSKTRPKRKSSTYFPQRLDDMHGASDVVRSLSNPGA